MTEFEKAFLKEFRKTRKALESLAENVDLLTATVNEVWEAVKEEDK